MSSLLISGKHTFSEINNAIRFADGTHVDSQSNATIQIRGNTSSLSPANSYKLSLEEAMFRYEQKYLINRYQYEEIRPVLDAMSERDTHVKEKSEYMIRSLYFDDMYRSAYNEKTDGIYQRKKYRIRIYNCSDEVINLECKYKVGAYINKEFLRLTRDEFDKILVGDSSFLLKKDSQMAKEFYVDVCTKLLKPHVIVDYEREPFVFDAGNVRITFDKNVRAGYWWEDFFARNIPVYNVYKEDKIILEIKFTGYLPERIHQIFKVRNFIQISASKFCLCTDKLNEIQ